MNSSKQRRVLFVCVHNSGRSQMAEAFVNALSDGKIIAESAGTIPVGTLNPTAVEAMREKGISMTGQHPKVMTQDMVDRADKVITMGCALDEACPAVFVPSEDWCLDDPKDRALAEVRRIRDEIEANVKGLLEEL